MPGYAGTGQATFVRQNQQIALFQQETNLAGVASIAVQLERNRDMPATGTSLQIYFTDASGKPVNPGGRNGNPKAVWLLT